MNIECYFLNWNEADTIALTINHYKTFCSKVIVYDNYSDDGSDLIAERMDCEVRKFGIPGVLDDFAYLEVKNNCWSGSQADYVIVCDLDEILYPRDPRHLLRYEKSMGTTLFRTAGYNMFSSLMPTAFYHQVRTGMPDGTYSKSIIFDPQKIREINYLPGCHVARPEGHVEVSKTTLSVLHYRCIGGFSRMLARHTLYNSRLSEANKRFKMGNYGWVTDPAQVEAKRKEFDACLRNSKVLESVFGS